LGQRISIFSGTLVKPKISVLTLPVALPFTLENRNAAVFTGCPEDHWSHGRHLFYLEKLSGGGAPPDELFEDLRGEIESGLLKRATVNLSL
jgi:hypothetical protein